ncbi:hypothetical protein H0178_55310 [Cytobacillus firmus]|nr:hypothetical protein [Cytobacillus firmus]
MRLMRAAHGSWTEVWFQYASAYSVPKFPYARYVDRGEVLSTQGRGWESCLHARHMVRSIPGGLFD